MNMSGPFTIEQWRAFRAETAAHVAAGRCDPIDGRNHLAQLDAYIGSLAAAQARDGARYGGRARPASQQRSNYFAFLSRFDRAPRAAADVGRTGLVTDADGIATLHLYGPI